MALHLELGRHGCLVGDAAAAAAATAGGALRVSLRRRRRRQSSVGLVAAGTPVNFGDGGGETWRGGRGREARAEADTEASQACCGAGQSACAIGPAQRALRCVLSARHGVPVGCGTCGGEERFWITQLVLFNYAAKIGLCGRFRVRTLPSRIRSIDQPGRTPAPSAKRRNVDANQLRGYGSRVTGPRPE